MAKKKDRAGNTLAPWWKVAWRILWIPLLIVGRLIYCFAMLMMYGKRGCEQAWRDTE